jgi:hypothetical protein
MNEPAHNNTTRRVSRQANTFYQRKLTLTRSIEPNRRNSALYVHASSHRHRQRWACGKYEITSLVAGLPNFETPKTGCSIQAERRNAEGVTSRRSELSTRAQQVIDLTHVFSRHPHWDDPATAHVPPDAHDPEFDREHRERKRAALANARTSGKKGKTVTPTSLPRPQVAGGAPPPNKHAAFGLLTPTRLPRREKRQDRTPPSSPSTAQDDSNDDSSSDGWQTVGSGKKNHKGRKPNSGPKSPSN